MSRDTLADLREESRAIIQHISECMVAARNFEKAAAESSLKAIDSGNALLARLRTMHGMVHKVDVHIARAGDTLISDMVLSELREQTKKTHSVTRELKIREDRGISSLCAAKKRLSRSAMLENERCETRRGRRYPLVQSLIRPISS